jgi:hypothetical protein
MKTQEKKTRAKKASPQEIKEKISGPFNSKSINELNDKKIDKKGKNNSDPEVAL